MNDFTKEELIWLEEDIACGIKEYQQPEIAYEIRRKLKFMIDNYCDHAYVCHKCMGKENDIDCYKCGKLANKNIDI